MKRPLPLANLIIIIITALLATGNVSGQSALPGVSQNRSAIITDTLSVNFAQKIKLYPVPVSSDLFIDNVANVTRIEIFDIMGNKHISEVCDNQDNLRISVSQLTRGMYFIRFTTPGSTAIKRFTKE
jgi:hypothetical protein